MSEIETTFSTVLEQRLRYTRKSNIAPLAEYSDLLITILDIDKSQQNSLFNILDGKIQKILRDCEIYFNMPKSKANDSIKELSNLAVIYRLRGSTDFFYREIIRLINIIKASYPNDQDDWVSSGFAAPVELDE